MSKNPSTLSKPLHSLTSKEIFIWTAIPLYLIEGFKRGEYKPTHTHRKRLSKTSEQFYAMNDARKIAAIQQKKWRSLKSFLSFAERQDLFSNPSTYGKKLDKYLDVHWDKIVVAVTEKFDS